MRLLSPRGIQKDARAFGDVSRSFILLWHGQTLLGFSVSCLPLMWMFQCARKELVFFAECQKKNTIHRDWMLCPSH